MEENLGDFKCVYEILVQEYKKLNENQKKRTNLLIDKLYKEIVIKGDRSMDKCQENIVQEEIPDNREIIKQTIQLEREGNIEIIRKYQEEKESDIGRLQEHVAENLRNSSTIEIIRKTNDENSNRYYIDEEHIRGESEITEMLKDFMDIETSGINLRQQEKQDMMIEKYLENGLKFLREKEIYGVDHFYEQYPIYFWGETIHLRFRIISYLFHRRRRNKINTRRFRDRIPDSCRHQSDSWIRKQLENLNIKILYS
jgi:hypothetical protein